MNFTDITNVELDDIVGQITKDYPFCGEGLMKQILADKGVKVQRMRLRDSIHRVDHEGAEIIERKVAFIGAFTMLQVRITCGTLTQTTN